MINYFLHLSSMKPFCYSLRLKWFKDVDEIRRLPENCIHKLKLIEKLYLFCWRKFSICCTNSNYFHSSLIRSKLIQQFLEKLFSVCDLHYYLVIMYRKAFLTSNIISNKLGIRLTINSWKLKSKLIYYLLNIELSIWEIR